MKFPEFYSRDAPVISFELFPPKTKAAAKRLQKRLPKLISLEPTFLTVTYGALGSTRERTLEVVSTIRNRYRYEVAHHLTCVGHTQEELTRILEQIRAEGIENIVALRGDPPAGESEFVPPPGGFRYANQLVEHIRQVDGFGIAVAGYPEKHVEAPDFESDLRHLKHKVDAGADVVITQLFYDNRHFFEFVERCRNSGITQPIIPGLLPILGLPQIRRITGMCGSTIPDSLMEELLEAKEDVSRVREIGIRHTVEQALDLLGSGVDGIHFYVLNRYFHIAEIMAQLRPALEAGRTPQRDSRPSA